MIGLIIFIIIFIFNLLLIGTMIFVERKKPERIAAWSIVLTFLPVIGFILYALIGGGLSLKTKKMLKKKKLYNENYAKFLQKQVDSLYNDQTSFLDKDSEQYKDIITLNMHNNKSAYSKNNKIDFFHNGKDFFSALKKDLLQAKSSINLQFYIFANDKIGKEITNILALKASEGVEVKLLYDSVGSLHTGKHIFKNLVKNGGQVAEFFPPLMGIKLINFKANYRNHRKIVVIDGKISYTGGINVRDDHLGDKKRLAPWRDEQIRIEGSATYSLQNIFFSDWRNAINDLEKPINYLSEKYFPVLKFNGNVAMQILSSGPESTSQQIKEAMIKMINGAKKSIKIQTPYFIPDDSFVDALKLAILSGVKVEIMIPKLADRKIVYNATISYAVDVQKLGAKILIYDGFLHAKTMLVDDKVLTLGSCNIDIRSFALNFEDNVMIYNQKSAKYYSSVFDADRKNSKVLSRDYYKNTTILKKAMLSFSRIFSPLL